jgi:hypothetical protein
MRTFNAHLYGHVEMHHRAAPELDQQRVFVVRQGGGREFGAIEKAFDLIRSLAFRKDKPGQQPGSWKVTVSLARQPPAKSGAMAKKRIEQLKHDPTIPVVDVAPAPKEGRCDRIDRAPCALDVTQQIKRGLQASSGDHDQMVNLLER